MGVDAKRLLILKAVADGAETLGSISRASGVPKDEVRELIPLMVASGLLRRETKKGWLGEKTVYRITERGLGAIREAEREAKRLKERLEEAYKSGSKRELEEMVEGNWDLIHLMLLWGMLDYVWLTGLLGNLDLDTGLEDDFYFEI